MGIETNVIPRNFEIEEEQTDLQEEPLCVLCEYAMKVLLQESGIMSNRTIDMAEHAVEMLCSYMPETIEDKCIDLVQEYGDQIIEIILKEEFDPEQICAILTLCNVSATSTWDASPVGGNDAILVLHSGANPEFMLRLVEPPDIARKPDGTKGKIIENGQKSSKKAKIC